MRKLFLVILAFILVSCSSIPNTLAIEPTQSPAGIVESNPEAAYSTGGSESAYPGAASGETACPAADLPAVNDVTIVPSIPGTGTLTGTILLNGRPVVDVNIYLAETRLDVQGIERVAEMDVVTSPRSYTNNKGEFTVTNIPTGRYAVILDIAVSSILLVNPNTQTDLVVNITADETTDLGTLDYNNLPIPNTYVK